MLEALLSKLGIDVAASVIVGFINKFIFNNQNASEVDIKNEIKNIINNNDTSKVGQIYDSLVQNSLIINNNNKILCSGDGGSAYSESGPATGGAGGSFTFTSGAGGSI